MSSRAAIGRATPAPGAAGVQPRVERGRAGALLVLVVASLLLFASRVRESPAARAELDLDEAWKVSLADRFEHGEVAGRDFFYTYGPATQAVTWLATRLHAERDVLASAPLADLLFVALNLVLLCVLLWWFELGIAGTALAFVILAAARVAEHYATFRVLLVVFAALAAGAALAAPGRRRQLALGFVAGALAVLAQLVSADLLVLAVLAMVATGLLSTAVAVVRELRLGFPGTAAVLAEWPAILGVGAAATAAVAAGNLAVAAFGAPAMGFLGYHREWVAMIAGYGLTMGQGWALDAGRTLALLAAVALLGVWTLRCAGPANPQRARLLALLGAAVVCARSALTRSDLGHIALGFTPWVVLLAVLAGLELKRTRALGPGSLCAMGLLLASWPLTDLGGIGRALGAPAQLAEVRQRVHALRHATVDRSAVLRRAPLHRGVQSRLGQVRAALEGGGRLAVVPWENHLATALGAVPAGSILQAYAVHTPEAQQRWLDALRAEPTTPVLLAVDHLGTQPLGAVLTPVRLPAIWRGLLEELRPAAPADAGGAPYLLLERRTAPRRLRARPVAVRGRSTTAHGGEQLALVAAPCRLLSLELRLDYPPWLALGRPEPLELEVSGPGGPIVVSWVVPLRQGASFEILVPLIPMDRLAELWAEATPPVAAVSALRLRRLEERLAAAPSRREVRAVSCLEW